MLGFHLATQNSGIPRPYLHYIPTTLQVLWILSLTIAMSHLAGNAVRFYGSHMTGAAGRDQPDAETGAACLSSRSD